MLVTSLPRDRLSQVTRRGMLAHTKSHTKLHTASQSEERHVGRQRETGGNKGPSGWTVAQRGILREHARMQEREEVNLRGATSELSRLLEPEESYTVRIPFSTDELISETNVTTVDSNIIFLNTTHLC